MIRVYIVSGFLGSGKTTFIKKLLEANLFEKPMLIENEFGEIGIDSALFDSGLRVKEINSGCICCSLKGDLSSVIKDIKKMDVKDLIIEPSGVGKLSEVMMTILHDDDLRLVSHICIVDTKKALSYHRNFKEFFDDQVIGANAIILSKLEDVDPDKVKEVIAMIEGLNDEVEILSTPYRDMEAKELFAKITANACDCSDCAGCFDTSEIDEKCHHDHEHHHHHHHDAEEVFVAYSFKTERIFTREELASILEAIKDKVVRLKGIVSGDKYSLYFDVSGDDILISHIKTDKVGIVTVIGTDLDKARLEELFH